MYIKTLTTIVLSLFTMPVFAHMSDTAHSHAIEFFSLFSVMVIIPTLWHLLKNRLMVSRKRNDQ